MSFAKKKQEVNPGIVGPIVIGVLVAGIGWMLGFVQLIDGEPEVIDMARRRSAPAEEEAGPGGFLDRAPVVVEAFRGPRSGGNYQMKRQQVLTGQYPVAISASELNAWSRRALRIKEPESPGFFYVLPEAPNFWVSEGTLHVSMSVEIVTVGQRTEAFLVARGNLEPAGGGLKFTPSEMYLGRAKVPSLGPMQTMLSKMVMGVFRETEEYNQLVEVLNNVSNVELVEGGLTLS